MKERKRKPGDWSHDFFTLGKRRIDALIGCIIIFTGEQKRIARSPLLLIDKQHISKSSRVFFFRKMTSKQTNRLQSLDSSVEKFIHGHENENAKQKTKHDVALFYEFLVFNGRVAASTSMILIGSYLFSVVKVVANHMVRFSSHNTSQRMSRIACELLFVSCFHSLFLPLLLCFI